MSESQTVSWKRSEDHRNESRLRSLDHLVETAGLSLLMPLIRTAIDSDFGAIGSVFHEAIHQVAKLHYSEEQLRAWSPEALDAEHWRKRTAELEVRVAVVEGRVAGFIGFSRTGYVDLLFTRPEFTRRGVAKALLLHAEGVVGELGVRTAWTEASLAARSFFEAMGYRAVREQTVRCRGIELRNYRMEKPLACPVASGRWQPDGRG